MSLEKQEKIKLGKENKIRERKKCPNKRCQRVNKSFLRFA